jgi:SAM-dependent methyltransferase
LRSRRRREKVASIVTAETILYELHRFLRASAADEPQGSVLDLGAGTRPYRSLYEPFFARSRTTDVSTSPHDTAEVDLIATAESLPFADASFDAVICTEVLEHCRDPRAAMHEIRRVLRPAGRGFITTPFLVPLHEMPHDYHRFTPSGLKELAGSSSLAVESLVTRGDYLALFLAVLALPVSKLFQRLSSVLKIDLHRPENPFIFVALVLPQRMYFLMWRRMREGRAPIFRRVHERLAYYALGYVLVVRREADASPPGDRRVKRAASEERR